MVIKLEGRLDDSYLKKRLESLVVKSNSAFLWLLSPVMSVDILITDSAFNEVEIKFVSFEGIKTLINKM